MTTCSSHTLPRADSSRDAVGAASYGQTVRIARVRTCTVTTYVFVLRFAPARPNRRSYFVAVPSSLSLSLARRPRTVRSRPRVARRPRDHLTRRRARSTSRRSRAIRRRARPEAPFSGGLDGAARFSPAASNTPRFFVPLSTQTTPPIMARVIAHVALALALCVLGADAAAVDLTSKTFDKEVFDSGKSAFVKFFAPWCAIAPRLSRRDRRIDRSRRRVASRPARFSVIESAARAETFARPRRGRRRGIASTTPRRVVAGVDPASRSRAKSPTRSVEATRRACSPRESRRSFDRIDRTNERTNPPPDDSTSRLTTSQKTALRSPPPPTGAATARRSSRRGTSSGTSTSPARPSSSPTSTARRSKTCAKSTACPDTRR